MELLQYCTKPSIYASRGLNPLNFKLAKKLVSFRFFIFPFALWFGNYWTIWTRFPWTDNTIRNNRRDFARPPPFESLLKFQVFGTLRVLLRCQSLLVNHWNRNVVDYAKLLAAPEIFFSRTLGVARIENVAKMMTFPFQSRSLWHKTLICDNDDKTSILLHVFRSNTV